MKLQFYLNREQIPPILLQNEFALEKIEVLLISILGSNFSPKQKAHVELYPLFYFQVD